MVTSADIAATSPHTVTNTPSVSLRDRAAHAFGHVGQWQYAESGKRDLRLDFLRGLAVCAMVADHLGGEPSWLYAVTGGNHFLFSAAEGFVFISGLVMGIVYARVIAKSGIADAMWKSVRRAGMLYFLTVTLSFGFSTVSYWTQMPWVDGVRVLDPIGRIIERLTLHRAFYLTDVLLMYTLLIAAAPIVFLLLFHKRTPLVLAGSWLMWGVYQFAPEQMELPWHIEDNSVFHFAAWQALFFTGIVIGYHRDRVMAFVRRIPAAPAFAVLAALCAGAIVLYNDSVHLLAPFAPDGDTASLMDSLFGKADLRIGRVLTFAVFFAALALLTTFAWRPLFRALGWLLMPLGQNALLAYSLHLGVIVLFTKAVVLTPALQTNAPSLNTLLQLAGILSVWGGVRLAPTAQKAFVQVRGAAPIAAQPRAVRVSVSVAASRSAVEQRGQ